MLPSNPHFTKMAGHSAALHSVGRTRDLFCTLASLTCESTTYPTTILFHIWALSTSVPHISGSLRSRTTLVDFMRTISVMFLCIYFLARCPCSLFAWGGSVLSFITVCPSNRSLVRVDKCFYSAGGSTSTGSIFNLFVAPIGRRAALSQRGGLSGDRLGGQSRQSRLYILEEPTACLPILCQCLGKNLVLA